MAANVVGSYKGPEYKILNKLDMGDPQDASLMLSMLKNRTRENYKQEYEELKQFPRLKQQRKFQAELRHIKLKTNKLQIFLKMLEDLNLEVDLNPPKLPVDANKRKIGKKKGKKSQGVRADNVYQDDITIREDIEADPSTILQGSSTERQRSSSTFGRIESARHDIASAGKNTFLNSPAKPEESRDGKALKRKVAPFNLSPSKSRRFFGRQTSLPGKEMSKKAEMLRKVTLLQVAIGNFMVKRVGNSLRIEKGETHSVQNMQNFKRLKQELNHVNEKLEHADSDDSFLLEALDEEINAIKHQSSVNYFKRDFHDKNNYVESLIQDKNIKKYLTEKEITSLAPIKVNRPTPTVKTTANKKIVHRSQTQKSAVSPSALESPSFKVNTVKRPKVFDFEPQTEKKTRFSIDIKNASPALTNKMLATNVSRFQPNISKAGHGTPEVVGIRARVNSKHTSPSRHQASQEGFFQKPQIVPKIPLLPSSDYFKLMQKKKVEEFNQSNLPFYKKLSRKKTDIEDKFSILQQSQEITLIMDKIERALESIGPNYKEISYDLVLKMKEKYTYLTNGLKQQKLGTYSTEEEQVEAEKRKKQLWKDLKVRSKSCELLLIKMGMKQETDNVKVDIQQDEKRLKEIDELLRLGEQRDSKPTSGEVFRDERRSSVSNIEAKTTDWSLMRMKVSNKQPKMAKIFNSSFNKAIKEMEKLDIDLRKSLG